MNKNTPINQRFRLTEDQKKGLERLKLETLEDLILYLPNRYEARGVSTEIASLTPNQYASVVGQVISSKTSKAYRKKIPLGEAIIKDNTGRLQVVWFHQPYLAKKLIVGQTVQLSGKVTARNDKLYMANPDIGSGDFTKSANSLFNKDEEITLIPVYSETKGLSSGWFYYHILQLLAERIHEQIPDSLPEKITKTYNLPQLKTALVWIHSPKKIKDTESARKRFSFNEIFLIQLHRLQNRSLYHQNKAHSIQAKTKDITEFTKRFGFPLTKAQQKAIKDITKDIENKEPMMRLLEGDVGSGKTAVAATVVYTTVKAGGSVAYMAPTEILAKQHFQSFIKYFDNLNTPIGLLTGSGCFKYPSKIKNEEATKISRTQLLKWVSEGIIPILVGTHALIQKSVKFKNLSLAIIDEQHRFGINQRSKLIKQNENFAPHLLSMTATPIPRTLALTIYGDLDLSLIDEMPAGRKPIMTKIITKDQREEMYEKIRQEIKNGRQVYIICPRIDEPDPNKALALNVRSAKAEAKRLKEKIFPEFEIGLLHSKLKTQEKESVMEDFSQGKINILVATSVVEVGVNVANATTIVIEGADRFGLAQLHQLRGRVIRSEHQAYCYLLTDSTSTKTVDRLKALTRAKNGFELAELDLSLRGPGVLAGTKQWGISDLGMEAIKNIKMVEVARNEAQKIISTDPDLTEHPDIKTTLNKKEKIIHFE